MVHRDGYKMLTIFEWAEIMLAMHIEDTKYENKVYFVGGCVRDEMMGIPIKDLDILVDMPQGGIKLANFLCEKFPQYYSNLVVYERFGTAKITFTFEDLDTVDLEFVEPRIEVYDPTSRKPIKVEYTSLETDALRRDFTVNALYKNISTSEIVDPTGNGADDIARNFLRTPTDPEITFYDDPLRMLRAIRFMCQKGFVICDEIKIAIKNNAYRLQGDCATKAPISKERIHDEFKKIIMSDNPTLGVEWLHFTELFKYMFDGDTSVYDMFMFDQKNEHHNEFLGVHCLKVLDFVSHKKDSSLDVRLAALFHDIGKLKCYQVKPDGIHYSYHGHEDVSAEMTYKLLKNLKFSNYTCDRVKFLISHHMDIKQLNDGNGHLDMKDKTFRKFVRRFGEQIDDMLLLMDGDNKSHASESANRLWYQIDDFRDRLNTMQYKSLDDKSLKSPVNGNDIMEFFWITPGPRVKELLEQAQDIFDEEPSLTKDEILKKIKV